MARDTVDVHTVQYHLACNVVNSLKLVQRIVDLHKKKLRRIATSKSRGVTFDTNMQAKVAKAVRRMSQARGQNLPMDAFKRYGKRFTVDQLMGLAATYSACPSFLDPVVLSMWHSHSPSQVMAH